MIIKIKIAQILRSRSTSWQWVPSRLRRTRQTRLLPLFKIEYQGEILLVQIISINKKIKNGTVTSFQNRMSTVTKNITINMMAKIEISMWTSNISGSLHNWSFSQPYLTASLGSNVAIFLGGDKYLMIFMEPISRTVNSIGRRIFLANRILPNQWHTWYGRQGVGAIIGLV